LLSHAVPAPMIWVGMVAWTGLALTVGTFVLRRLRGELRDAL